MKQMFKAGDTVRLVYQKKTRLFILEVQLQTCYANVQQVWYFGRVFVKRGFYGEETLGKYERFSAIEVEALPEPTDEIMALKEKAIELQGKKKSLIEKQKFDEAAEVRREEKEVLRKIELFEDIL